MSVRIAATDLVNSAVVCHPGSIDEDEIIAIKVVFVAKLFYGTDAVALLIHQVPTSWACAESKISILTVTFPHSNLM